MINLSFVATSLYKRGLREEGREKAFIPDVFTSDLQTAALCPVRNNLPVSEVNIAFIIDPDLGTLACRSFRNIEVFAGLLN